MHECARIMPRSECKEVTITVDYTFGRVSIDQTNEISEINRPDETESSLIAKLLIMSNENLLKTLFQMDREELQKLHNGMVLSRLST